MPYCFDVKFRTARPIGADKLEEVFKPRAFKRPLRLYRPDGMNRHEGWLAVESCGYSSRTTSFWGHVLAECSADPHLEEVWDFRSFFTLTRPRISANSV